MKMRKNIGTLTIFVCVTTLAIVGLVSYYANTSLDRSSSTVLRTLDSLRASGAVKADTHAGEAAVYSYLYNRKPETLAEYYASDRRLTISLAELTQFVSHTPKEDEALQEIQHNIENRRHIFAMVLRQRDERSEVKEPWPNAVRGHELTDLIDKQLALLEHEERTYLEVSEDQERNRRFYMSLIVWIAGAVAMVMVVMAIFFIRRESWQKRRSRQRVAAQFAATRLLSESVTLAQASRRMLPELALTLGFDAAELWLRDNDGVVRCKEHWLAASVPAAYSEALQQNPVAGPESLPTRVFTAQESLWIEDMGKQDNLSAYAGALAAGLHSAVAVPVLIWPDIAGVIVMLSRRKATTDNDLYQTLTAIGAQFGQFITRRRTMESLANNTELQRAILQSANFSIIATDAAGVIQIFNATAEKWLQYNAQDLLSRSTPVIFHRSEELEKRALRLSEELGAPVEAGVEALIAKARRGAIDENEWTYLRRDGSSFPVQLSVTALRDSGGMATGFLLIGKDITERREIDRMKNEFVSIVSHELRTPLTSVRGSLGLLAAGLMGDVGDKAKRMLQIGINNTDRLVRLINDILDIERLESGKVALERHPISAEHLLQQSADTMRGMAEKNGVKIHRQPFDATVNADADRIVQTLTNLLGNAVKFSTEGSTIEIGGFSNNKVATLYVRDFGRGVPREKQGIIFERFQQVDASDAREKGGTGLGLAICRTIVEQHGGHIWVESKPGEGSVFYFTLPLVEAAEEKTELLAGDRPAKILVCDDDAWLRGIVTSLLRQGGFVPVTAATGGELLAMLEKESPDVVLLDLVLPDIPGWEVLSRLRQMPRFASLPVIVLSSLAESEERAKATAPVQGWVQKPFDTRRLYRAIQMVLKRPKPSVVLLGTDEWCSRMAKYLDGRGVKALNASVALEDSDVNLHSALLVLDLAGDEPNATSRLDPFKNNPAWEKNELLVLAPATMSQAGLAELLWKHSRLLPGSGEMRLVAERICSVVNELISKDVGGDENQTNTSD